MFHLLAENKYCFARIKSYLPTFENGHKGDNKNVNEKQCVIFFYKKSFLFKLFYCILQIPVRIDSASAAVARHRLQIQIAAHMPATDSTWSMSY